MLNLRKLVLRVILSQGLIYGAQPLPNWDPIKSEKELLAKYQVPEEYCKRATINRDINKSAYIDELHELVCLILGYRNIITDFFLCTYEEYLTPDLLNNLINKYHIKDSGQIIYTPKGGRSALLLEKYDTKRADLASKKMDWSKPVRVVDLEAAKGPTNAYLIGKLLEYPEDDITYFYIRRSFLFSNIVKNLELDRSILIWPLRDWPIALRNTFTYYETNIWPHTQDFKQYQNDIHEAQRFFQEN